MVNPLISVTAAMSIRLWRNVLSESEDPSGRHTSTGNVGMTGESTTFPSRGKGNVPSVQAMSGLRQAVAALATEGAAFLIRASGVPFVVRHLIARNNVSIVLYHDPSPGVFRAHLEYLTANYSLLSLGEYFTARDANVPLPRYALIVTLDDGHARNELLARALSDYHVTPMIYLCSAIVGTRRGFWFKCCDGRSTEHLKRVSHAERLKQLADKHAFVPDEERPDEPQALSRAAIAGLATYAEFGSHGRLHPILPSCTYSECNAEILDSKTELEAMLQRPVKDFAYPNGDFTDRELALVRAAGYRSARSTKCGWNDRHTHPFRLKIVAITGDVSVNVLRAQLSGVTLCGRQLVKTLRCITRSIFKKSSRAWRLRHNSPLNNSISRHARRG